MFRFIFLISFLIKPTLFLAQNSWLENGLTYLKIAVDKDGIYKIEKNEIEKSNFLITDYNNLKLFYRGHEIPFIVENKNPLEKNDLEYILFYGLKNNGDLDSNLYVPKNSRPHSYYSIYSDKSYYFLVQSNTQGKRIEVIKNNSDNFENKTVVFKEILKVWQESSTFSTITSWAPNLMQSYFEPGEILSSNIINCNKYDNGIKVSNDIFTSEILLPNLINDDNIKIDSEIFTTGRWQNNSRVLNLVFNDSLYSKKNIQGYDFFNFKNKINPKNINDKKLRISINASNVISSLPFDAFTVSYIKINYPTNLLFEGIYNINSNKGHFELIKDENYNPFIWDITNPLQPKIVNSLNLKSKIILPLENDKISKLYVSDQIYSPLSISTIKHIASDYANYNFFILTDSRLFESAEVYKNYRQSAKGGKYNVKIVDIHKLYNEYSFGEKTPYAIQKWSESFSSTSNEEKHLLILGKSYSLTDNLKKNEARDFVPTIGFPASDMLLTNNYNLLTGRINAVNNEEVYSYLNKLKEFEADSSYKEWNKNFLYLGGGKTTSEYLSIKQLFDNLTKLSSEGFIGGNTKTFFKKNLSTSVESIDITKEINKGVGLLTFCGHSTIQVTDLNFGFASDNSINYSNKGKYPFMFFNGCGSGNIFTDNKKTLSSDWLLTPNKGAIAVLAHSQLSYLSSNSIYMEELHRQWFKSFEKLNITLGKLVKDTGTEVLKRHEDLYNLANVHQMVLQGDPAIRVVNMTKPDYKTENNDVFLSAKNIQKPIAENEEINLGLALANQGIYEAGSKFGVRINKTFKDGTKTTENLVYNAIPNSDTLYFNLKKDINLSAINFILDADKAIDEMDETNNSATLTFDWNLLKTTNFYSTATAVDVQNPNLSVMLANGDLPTDGFEAAQNQIFKLKLTDDFPFGNKQDKLTVFLQKICDSCTEVPKSISVTNITGSANEILADVVFTNLNVGNYQMTVQGFDNNKNPSGEVYTLNFEVLENSTSVDVVTVYPNPAAIFTQFNYKTNLKNNGYLLEITDSRGASIYKINGPVEGGSGVVYWDTSTNQKEQLANGMYYYNLTFMEANTIKSKNTGKILLRR